MLSPQQFYRRVGFGLTESDNYTDPQNAFDQLKNTKTVDWDHPMPKVIDGIKFLVDLKVLENKFQKEGLGTDALMKHLKENEIDHDIHRVLLPFRAHNAIHGPSPVLDRFQMFWGNHFPVHGKKVSSTTEAYHRITIRENLKGSFANLVKKVITSEAMMRYLDNIDNIAPDSSYAKKMKRQGSTDKLGFNENLGRELLELYTVSPSAMYTQEDVENATKILSGWGGDRKWEKKKGYRGLGDQYFPIVFRKDSHAKGSKKVLGKTYKGGKKELFDLIDDLCAKDECATFIATKLATHFISDNPSKPAIDHIKAAFKKSKGKLTVIHGATLEAVLKYGEPHQKVTWPEIWLIQAMKILDFRLYPLPPFKYIEDDFNFVGSTGKPIGYQKYDIILQRLGNNPLEHGQPNGYSDLSADWLSSELIDRRVIISMFAQKIVKRRDFLKNINFSFPESKGLREIAEAKMDKNTLVKLMCHRDFIRI